MNIRSLLAILAMCGSIGTARAAVDVEGDAIGYRKIYSNGYIELACKGAASCSVTVNLEGAQRTYALDLKTYGYKRAWDPIGAFLGQKEKLEPLSFYVTVDCLGDDYAVSERAEGEITCTALGRISGGKALLEQIRIDSLGEGDAVYRELAGVKQ